MLKVGIIEKLENECPKNFFIRFFEELPETYTEDGELQCKANRLRTYDDLYRIFQYYYPELKESDFINSLRYLIKLHYINSVFCGQVQDFTFYPLQHHYYSKYRPVFLAIGEVIYFNYNKALPFNKYGGYNLDKSTEEFLKKLDITIPETS